MAKLPKVKDCCGQTKARLFEQTVFMALLFTTFFFVRSLIEQYLEGSTYFSTSKQPITNNDLHTATVCFLARRKMEYGEDYTIQT